MRFRAFSCNFSSSEDQSLEDFRDARAWLELQRRMHSSVQRLESRGLSMLAYALARIKGFEELQANAIGFKECYSQFI